MNLHTRVSGNRNIKVRGLSLRHLTERDTERVEEAMNCNDTETMLAVVDDLISKAVRRATTRFKKPI
ncbi:protein of unknown function [Nitrospira japonica]|uniref:Uncharacterized protein n=1 Tax=Nitrospira japonica TaxID=1325564 RepID=A0A1W1I653_9BACT|nr:protein of unknown function [Nitrospira japonica]